MKSKRAASLISTAAVYATDRALLKRYINDQLIFLNPLQVHESHEAELERDITDTIKTSRVASAKVKQAGTEEKAPPKKQVIKRPAPEQKSEAIEHLPSSVPSDLDNIIEELYRDLEELKVNRAKLDQIENDLAEQEAVDHAVEKATKKAPSKDSSSSDDKTTSNTEESSEPKEEQPESVKSKAIEADDSPVTEQETKEETEEPGNEDKPIKASQSRSARRVKLTKEAEPDSSEEKKDKKKEDKPKSKKSSTKKSTAKKSKVKDKASDSKTSTKARSTSTKKTSKAKTSSKSSDKKEEDKSEGKKEKGETKSPPSKKADQESIIANFIKTNPSISPADASKMKVSSEDLSDHSTELHPDIASEYLAEIYLEQGSYDRAIQIYEALIVRFPEKSVYFADIIKKINEER